MSFIPRLAALLGTLLISASLWAADIDAQTYGYPLTNPFEATIATCLLYTSPSPRDS